MPAAAKSVFSYQMFRDLEKAQSRLHGHRRASRLRREPRLQGPDGQRRRHARHRQLFPAARAATRRSAGCSGRTTTATIGESHVVVLQPRLLADALRPESRGPQRHDHRQRPEPDDRRRGAAWVRRHDARRRGRDVFVPITLRATMEPGFDGFDNRRTYWAYLFARLKPGITVEQATIAAQRRRTTRSSTRSRRRCRRA